MWLMGTFALVALILAVIGIYGVLSYSVSQRRAEFGIRMALGAQPRDILTMVLRQGLRLVVWGIGLGLLAALALMRLLSSQLVGVTPTDPFIFGLVALLLSAIALLACYRPARRATRVDPLAAFRCQ
jgi:ABC-type antimicrobial peptide transport system permease subunit